MNGKFGIISKQTLILSKEQSIIILGKDSLQKKRKRSIYLLKQLKISFQTLFHTKQFSMMAGIPRGSVAKLKT